MIKLITKSAQFHLIVRCLLLVVCILSEARLNTLQAAHVVVTILGTVGSSTDGFDNVSGKALDPTGQPFKAVFTFDDSQGALPVGMCGPPIYPSPAVACSSGIETSTSRSTATLQIGTLSFEFGGSGLSLLYAYRSVQPASLISASLVSPPPGQMVFDIGDANTGSLGFTFLFAHGLIPTADYNWEMPFSGSNFVDRSGGDSTGGGAVICTNSRVAACGQFLNLGLVVSSVTVGGPTSAAVRGINYPLIWRPTTETWYGLPSPIASTTTLWGVPGDVPLSGKYTADGRANYAVWRPSSGEWWAFSSSTQQTISASWGSPGDIPIGNSDFDGDGRSDYAIWRPSSGEWWVLLSSTGQPIATPWGLPGDVPIGGSDFDGDGRSDYAVWRPSTGEWWVLSSNTGQPIATLWGAPGDIPVPGDFDGDGKTDYAVWRPSTGEWWVIASGSGQLIMTSWGLPGDIPIQGDFNNDGRSDFVVFRPDVGEWFVNYSGPGGGPQSGIQWGVSGDIPLGQVLTKAPPAN